MNLEMNCYHSKSAFRFLRKIGISIEIVDGVNGFVQKAIVLKGCLQVDPSCPASTMLHEAGHIAILPSRFRHFFSGDFESVFDPILQDPLFARLESNHPLTRAVLQLSDPEVTAWAWAAGKFLGLAEDIIIADDEYDSDGATLRLMLNINSYIGIHGLSHAGFCTVRKNLFINLPPYPELAHWLQH